METLRVQVTSDTCKRATSRSNNWRRTIHIKEGPDNYNLSAVRSLKVCGPSQSILRCFPTSVVVQAPCDPILDVLVCIVEKYCESACTVQWSPCFLLFVLCKLHVLILFTRVRCSCVVWLHANSLNKKLSYRWQTARCCFVKLLRYCRTFCQKM